MKIVHVYLGKYGFGIDTFLTQHKNYTLPLIIIIIIIIRSCQRTKKDVEDEGEGDINCS